MSTPSGPTDGFTERTDDMYQAAHLWRSVADALLGPRIGASTGQDRQEVFGPVARAGQVAAAHQEFAELATRVLATAQQTLDSIAGALEQTSATYDAEDRRAGARITRAGGS